MRFVLILFATLSLFSCENKSEIEFNSVKISPVFIDSLSIRAIASFR